MIKKKQFTQHKYMSNWNDNSFKTSLLSVSLIFWLIMSTQSLNEWNEVHPINSTGYKLRNQSMTAVVRKVVRMKIAHTSCRHAYLNAWVVQARVNQSDLNPTSSKLSRLSQLIIRPYTRWGVSSKVMSFWAITEKFVRIAHPLPHFLGKILLYICIKYAVFR